MESEFSNIPTEVDINKQEAQESSYPIEWCSSERLRALMDSIDESLAQTDIQATALPAIKLRLLNRMLERVVFSEAERQREVTKMYKLSESESETKAPGNPLPTIGVEIECPSDSLHKYIKNVVEWTGGRQYRDDDAHMPGGYTDEIAPSFTYSAWTSAQVVHELVIMGAIPLQENETGKKFVPEDVVIPLHVNYGLPEGLNREIIINHASKLGILSDVITIAFTSPQRIETRNTQGGAFNYGKSANESGKSSQAVELDEENEDSFEIGVSDDGTLVNVPKGGPKRLELRAVELRESSVYRLLAESQELMAMFFAYVKLQENVALSERERPLAELGERFFRDIQGTLLTYSPYFFISSLVDERPEHVTELIQTTDIQDRCRSIISEYARHIKNLIGNEET